MMTPTQAIFQFAGLQASLFPPNSRYQGIATGTLVTASGETIVYLRRRFVPPSSLFSPIQQHTVVQGERLDMLAAQTLGDPLMFWQLCDANGVMRPQDLETVGCTIVITLPQGIQGPTNA